MPGAVSDCRSIEIRCFRVASNWQGGSWGQVNEKLSKRSTHSAKVFGSLVISRKKNSEGFCSMRERKASDTTNFVLPPLSSRHRVNKQGKAMSIASLVPRWRAARPIHRSTAERLQSGPKSPLTSGVRERSRKPLGPILLDGTERGQTAFHKNSQHPAGFEPSRYGSTVHGRRGRVGSVP